MIRKTQTCCCVLNLSLTRLHLHIQLLHHFTMVQALHGGHLCGERRLKVLVTCNFSLSETLDPALVCVCTHPLNTSWSKYIYCHINLHPGTHVQINLSAPASRSSDFKLKYLHAPFNSGGECGQPASLSAACKIYCCRCDWMSLHSEN